jgi:hypothetical protein
MAGSGETLGSPWSALAIRPCLGINLPWHMVNWGDSGKFGFCAVGQSSGASLTDGVKAVSPGVDVSGVMYHGGEEVHYSKR